MVRFYTTQSEVPSAFGPKQKFHTTQVAGTQVALERLLPQRSRNLLPKPAFDSFRETQRRITSIFDPWMAVTHIWVDKGAYNPSLWELDVSRLELPSMNFYMLSVIAKVPVHFTSSIGRQECDTFSLCKTGNFNLNRTKRTKI